ncbi:MAG: ABC transporter ATP-binding protein/permease [Treponema sp.]|jgi:ATP-binding cassette subfamily B protein|nr:ABC transporter ATP-binding protein/permease [Treponema sp.]
MRGFSKSLKEYRTLFPYLKRFRNRYILGFICLIIVDAAQIAIPQFIRIAVDLISTGVFELKQIIILALFMIGTMTIVAVGRFFWRYFINGSSRRIEAYLREDLFDHLQKLSWDFYQKNKIGDLMARSINDLHSVRMAMGMGLVAFFDFIFMATAILIIIFIQDAGSAMYSIIPLPLITVLILVFGSMVGKKFRAAHEAYSKLSDNVQESFSGVSVIKSFVKEWWFLKKFADSNDDYRKANMELVRLFGFFFPLVTFLSGLTILVMLAIGGSRVINGLMTPGSLVAMFRYLGMLIWPLMGAGFMVNMIQRGAVSLGRINEILNTVPSIRDTENPQTAHVQAPVPALELSNLSFSYNEKESALDGINLKVNRGEWLGIMGRTGSGKSTLVKTFMRMLDPPQGTVSVFGLDVRDWSLEELRTLFAVSPQDSYLFSETIARNITYGKIFADDVTLENIINFASLSRDLSLFQSGKETLIGERGLTLSGGQKQRTAIARAMIMDSEFLVLDDSFSAVDNETEQKILEALRKERRERTTIIISHRVSTLKYADNVLVLDKGKCVEYGTPHALLQTGGFYSRMAAFQRLTTCQANDQAENSNG